MLWYLPTATELKKTTHAFRDAIIIKFRYGFAESTDGVVWPLRLQVLHFSADSLFDQPLAALEWPANSRQLTLWGRFDQPIEGVVWPASLQHLEVGRSFNQPIEGVLRPALL